MFVRLVRMRMLGISGSCADVLPLCEIGHVSPARARALFNARLRTVAAVATASLSDVVSAIALDKRFPQPLEQRLGQLVQEAAQELVRVEASALAATVDSMQ